MVAVGMVVLWFGYSIEFYGYCLLKGYDVPFRQLISPLHPYGSGKGQRWPPKQIPADAVLPGQKSVATVADIKTT